MIGRILVALGGTDYTLVAIETAIDLAKRYGAELTGVTVMNVDKLRQIGPVPAGAGEIANQLRDKRVAMSREAAEIVIGRFEAACTEAGVKHSVLREEHDETCHYLIKLSRYHDLAILGLRAAFEYGLPDAAGDPAQLVDRLVTGGVRPIIAVPNTPLNVRRTLVAYSGSMGSAKALRQYLRFNLWPEATMRIVTFGPDNEESQKLLADVSSYCGTYGIRPETGVIDASPIQGLLQASEDWNADMIVMGNSHKNLLLSRVLGKTLLQVVKESDKALFLGQ